MATLIKSILVDFTKPATSFISWKTSSVVLLRDILDILKLEILADIPQTKR